MFCACCINSDCSMLVANNLRKKPCNLDSGTLNCKHINLPTGVKTSCGATFLSLQSEFDIVTWVIVVVQCS